jgi:hypothetical protein
MNDFQEQLNTEIDDILQKRKRVSYVVKRLASRIANLKLILADLVEKIDIFSDQFTNTDFFLIKKSLESTKQKIIEEETEFERLYRRFGRQTINIGVIGQARQGKSTLLRRLSGLSDKVIPNQPGPVCTSTKSIIYHHEKQRTYAKVYFYSESEFLHNILRDYFESLNYPLPATIDEFKHRQIPEFKESNYQNPSTSKATDSRLRQFQEHVDSYAPFLEKKSRVIEVEAGDIEKYVSYQGDDYRNVAVQKVEIFHQFPTERTAVSSIGWIDMPGLGDTRLGDEDRMIKALGEDTDFILLVRRPQENDDLMNQDTLLSDSAHKALKHRLPLNQWSFMVLNYDGINFQSCTNFKNHKLRNSLYVSDIFIVNCDVADQAIERSSVLNVNQLLECVLQTLARNVESLDATYLNSFRKSFEIIQKNIRLCIKNMRDFSLGFDSHSKFVDYLSIFLTDLANKIETVRLELDNEDLTTDDPFRQKIQGSIENCRIEIDDYRKDSNKLLENDITSFFNQKRSLGGTYDNFIHQIRSNALANFHGIELGLKLSLWKKKDRICSILRDLHLDALVNPACDNEQFLIDLCSIIPPELGNLKRGFSFLSSFELQYKGFVQTIVWTHMSRHMSPLKRIDDLRVSTIKYSVVYNCLSTLLSEMSIEVIHEKLNKQDQGLLGKIPNSLDLETFLNLLSNPNIQAALQGLPQVGLSADLVRTLIEPIINAGISGVTQDNESVSSYQLDSEEIMSKILVSYEKAVNECEKALGRLLPTPLEIARSMVGEFIDHILLAKNVTLEWNKLLGKDDNRLLMWPELKETEERKESFAKWNDLLDNAETINEGLSDFT